jgi:hypothetical protein
MTFETPIKPKLSPAKIKAQKKYDATLKGKARHAKSDAKRNANPDIKAKKLILDKEYSRIAISRGIKSSFDEVYEKVMKRSKMSYGEFLQLCITQSEILIPLIPKYKPIKQ